MVAGWGASIFSPKNGRTFLVDKISAKIRPAAGGGERANFADFRGESTWRRAVRPGRKSSLTLAPRASRRVFRGEIFRGGTREGAGANFSSGDGCGGRRRGILQEARRPNAAGAPRLQFPSGDFSRQLGGADFRARRRGASSGERQRPGDRRLAPRSPLQRSRGRDFRLAPRSPLRRSRWRPRRRFLRQQ